MVGTIHCSEFSTTFESSFLIYINRYRRIPGDQCKGGAEQLVKKLIDYIDTKTPCEPPGKNPYWLSDHIDLKEKQKV